MQTTIKILPRSQALRFILFLGSGSLLALGLSVFSHYRYWYGTIKAVQTTQLNILANTIPSKLSLLLLNQDTEEIDRLLNSNYGFIGMVVTDCQQRLDDCAQEAILHRSGMDKGWGENFREDDLSQYPFDLLLDPPPTKTENYYSQPYSHNIEQTNNLNPGQIIGRVYYIRPNPPSVFNGLQSWLLTVVRIRISGWLHPYTIFWFLCLGSSLISWYFVEREIKRIETIAVFQKIQLEADINNIQHHNEQLNQEKQKLTQYLGSLTADIQSLNNQILTLQTEVNHKERELNQTYDLVEQTKTSLEKYQQQLTIIHQDSRAKSREQQELEVKIQETQLLLVNKEHLLSSLANNLEATKNSLFSLETERESTQHLLREKESENYSLEQEINTLHQKLTEQENRIRKLENERLNVDEWQQIIKSYDEDLKNLDQLREENESLLQEINKFKDIVGQLNLQLRYLKPTPEIEEQQDVEWTVICTQNFYTYWQTIPEKKQIKIATYINHLEVKSLQLSYPYSSDIRGSSLSMRELRPITNPREAIRILYRFTPSQTAILLYGFDKHQDPDYRKHIQIATREYQNYLDNPNNIISFNELWYEMSESARKEAQQNFMIENSI